MLRHITLAFILCHLMLGAFVFEVLWISSFCNDNIKLDLGKTARKGMN
jgi:hypothetical protein